jgi:hypothetical protein
MASGIGDVMFADSEVLGKLGALSIGIVLPSYGRLI